MYLGSRGIVLASYVAKTKALISFAVTGFVLAYAKFRFSHDVAYFNMFKMTDSRSAKQEVSVVSFISFCEIIIFACLLLCVI